MDQSQSINSFSTPVLQPYLSSVSYSTTEQSTYESRPSQDDFQIASDEKNKIIVGNNQNESLDQNVSSNLKIHSNNLNAIYNDEFFNMPTLADKVKLVNKSNNHDNSVADLKNFDLKERALAPKLVVVTDRKISTDEGEDLNSKIQQLEESELIATRPTHGIRFSKSAASLMDNQSAGCQTPTSQAGKLKFNDFQIISQLGEGAFGKVYQVIPKNLHMRSDSDLSFSSCTTPTTRSFNESNTKSFALKIVEKKLIFLEEKQHEVHIEKLVLSHMNSPYIVKLKSSFHDKCRLYFLLEFIQNGSLADFLKRENIISLRLAKHFTAEILLALEQLRINQIIHRDLKPGNILLDNNYHIKLIDFATAKILDQDLASKIPKKPNKKQEINEFNDMDLNRQHSFVGTEEYLSPEVIQDKEISYSSDLWSLGIVLYQLLVGRTPYKGNSQLDTFENIMSNKIEFPQNFNEDAKDLISKLLILESQLRIGANDIQQLKEHKFFAEINFSNLREQLVPYQRSNLCGMRLTNRKNIMSSFNLKSLNERDNIIEEEKDEISCSSLTNSKTQIKISNINDLDLQRRRSSSFYDDKSSQVSRTLSYSDMVVKRGIMKKKGIIFYNNRLLILDAKGILTYYDPKNLDYIRGKIDIKNPNVIVRYIGKQKDTLEIKAGEQTYQFKDQKNNQDEAKSWYEAMKNFAPLKI